MKIGKTTINFGEIKKLIGGGLGILGLLLVQFSDLIPEQWRPVAAGIVALLGIFGIWKPTGPTGLPVIHRSNGSHTQPG